MRAKTARWQFEPHSSFTEKRTRWAYWLVVGSLWSLFVIFPAWPAFTYAQQLDGTEKLFYTISSLTLGFINAAVMGWWLKRGFNLRTRRDQALVAMLWSLAAALVIFVAIYPHWDTSPLLFVLNWSTFMIVVATTVFGPAYIGLIFTAIIGGIAHVYSGGEPRIFAPLVAVSFLAVWYSSKFNLWYTTVLQDLEAARQTAAELSVAKERLRFSTDVHDVMGRALSAISLKTQLADQLMARQGHDAREKARQQLAEISELTATTLREIRSLVQGYRRPSAAQEYEGALSLLQSAGIEVRTAGTLTSIGESSRELAAIFLREATTNVLRHSRATRVDLTVEPGALTMSNNRPDPCGDGRGVGLQTLAQRAQLAGGRLDILQQAERFTIRLILHDDAAGATAPADTSASDDGSKGKEASGDPHCADRR